MKKVLTTLISGLLLAVFAASSFAGKVYVYRNAEGVLVFSDAPQGAAEEVKLTTKPTVVPAEDTSILNQSPEPQEGKVQYKIELTQPAQDATVRDNTGSVYVSANVKPIFGRGLKIRLLLDGQQYGEVLGRTTQIMRNINRGEHTVQMELLNQTGKVIASSQLTTFYVHRNSVAKAR